MTPTFGCGGGSISEMDYGGHIDLQSYPPRMRRAILETFFEAMTLVGMAYLRAHPNTPPLLKSGVRYRREGKPERWKDIPTILEDGYDDCEGLAIWRAAELRLRGRPAVVRLKRTGPGLLHAVVQDVRTGKVYDPSKKLGMGRERKR